MGPNPQGGGRMAVQPYPSAMTQMRHGAWLFALWFLFLNGPSTADGAERTTNTASSTGSVSAANTSSAANVTKAINTASSTDLARARQFWSFVKPSRPRLPSVRQGEAVRSPIDAFILQKLEAHGLSPNPPAERRTLARRLYFDLVGLPPTPEEIDAFLKDTAPGADGRLVERLLASPHYGERWGRHWLDVAGFAESSLFIGDVFRPYFWRYRDYVIRAFNNDKPYDRFVVEQLAGDESFDWRATEQFTPEQTDCLVATGFLRCPPDATDNQEITQMEKRYAAQQAVVEVSMKALLGLTLNCVRCHSHKYDPIPQEDYYRLIGLFQPAFDPENWVAGIWTKERPYPLRGIPLQSRLQREEFERQHAAWSAERHRLTQELQTVLRRWRDRYVQEHPARLEAGADSETLRQLARKPAAERSETEELRLAEACRRSGIDTNLLQRTFPEYEAEVRQARGQLARVRDHSGALPPLAWATYDVSSTPSPVRLLKRGNYETPGDEIAPGVLSILDDPAHPFRLAEQDDGAGSGSNTNAASHGSSSPTQGRRLALAQWLTRREHPLPARVMVNRVWQYHFGNGLVETPDDFGARGSRPTHPELLDWLAVEFMENGWSIKHLHRLILLSTTYQQASGDGPRKGRPSVDAPTPATGNAERWLARFPRRRLEAEPIRDALLRVAGLLDLRQFGETVPTVKGSEGEFSIPRDHVGRYRRSVYLTTRRTWLPTFLALFDAPAMDTNWPKRSRSAIAPQALALMNNPLMVECAERFAERVKTEAGPGFTPRLARAFLLAYGRPPAKDEIVLMRGLMETPARREGESDDTDWRMVCHALLSSNEFLYVD